MKRSAVIALLLVLALLAPVGGQQVVVGPAQTPVVSTQAESGHVLKGSAGQLYSVYVTATASGLVMVFNSATVPADGAVTPIECVPLLTNTNGVGNVSISYLPGPPAFYSSGISVAYSSGTNCFSKAASAVAFIHGTVQ